MAAKPKIIAKVHSVQNEMMLAMADISALGKKYSGNGRVLDLEKFRQFYDGEIKEEEKIASLLSECTVINAVGDSSVGILIKSGLAKKSDIADIGGLPHVQVYKIPKS